MKKILASLFLAACSHAAAPAATPAPAPVTAAVVPAATPVPDVLAQANAEYEQQHFHACGELFADASARSENRKAAEYAYNAACCYSLAGELDASFTQLDRSIAGGYFDLNLLDHDTDLTNARADARWTQTRGAAQTKQDAYVATLNQELFEIHQVDQADRQAGPSGIDWSVVHPRDLARQKRVREIVAAGEAKTSADYYHAAMVLQHGDHPEDYELANAWCMRALELDPSNENAKWLAAASKDRYLMSLDKPQLYGTQFKKVDGTWVLHPVDPSITDEERARWNVPPLAEARKRAESMNNR
jgi:hypothetical protein